MGCSKGRVEVTQLTATNAKASHWFHDKKVNAPVHPRHLGGAQLMRTWLKSREIMMLMSP
jgi:hypothetical protein